MRDLRANVKGVSGIVPVVATSTQTGATVDLSGFFGVAVYVQVGAGGITFTGTNRIDLQIQESDDGSTWTAPVQNDVLGQTVDASGIFKSYVAAKAAASV